jgi:hypothetical protein
VTTSDGAALGADDAAGDAAGVALAAWLGARLPSGVGLAVLQAASSKVGTRMERMGSATLRVMAPTLPHQA